MHRNRHLTEQDKQFMSEIVAKVEAAVEPTMPMGKTMWSKEAYTREIFVEIHLATKQNPYYKLMQFMADKTRAALLGEDNAFSWNRSSVSAVRRLRLALMLARYQAILFGQYDRHLTISECNEMALPLTENTVQKELHLLIDKGLAHKISCDETGIYKRMVPTPYYTASSVVRMLSQSVLEYALMQQDRLATAIGQAVWIEDFELDPAVLSWAKQRFHDFYPVDNIRMVQNNVHR